jgi:hypothetical protein
VVTTRAWFLGVAAAVLAVVAHAAIPRYEWRPSPEFADVLVRVDRWTGRAEVGFVRLDWGRWVSVTEYREFVAQHPAPPTGFDFTGIARAAEPRRHSATVLGALLAFLAGALTMRLLQHRRST